MAFTLPSETIQAIKSEIIIAPLDATREDKMISVKKVPYTFRLQDDLRTEYKYTDEEISRYESREADLAHEFWIVVPEHQRLYVWDKKQQQKLITSVINGFPIPEIKLNKGSTASEYCVEDGQQRLTTLFLFMTNRFHLDTEQGWKIFYDSIPNGHGNNCVVLEQIGLKSKFDNYQLKAELAIGFPEEIHTEMFERLNSGKSLDDGDRYWNRRDSSTLVKLTEMILESSEFSEKLNQYFGLSWKKIEKKRTLLRDAVGLIGGLSVPCADLETPRELKVMCLSFTKNYKYLNIEDLASFEDTEKRMRLLLVTFQKAYGTNEHKFHNDPKENRNFKRWISPMILDLRERQEKFGSINNEDMINEYLSIWIPILRDFSKPNVKVTDTEHPHKVMYLRDDLGNKLDKGTQHNADGLIVKQRLQLIKNHYNRE